MGTEYYLVRKKNKEDVIHCGRSHTFNNAFTESNGLYNYLRLYGLTKSIIYDICIKLISLKDVQDSFYHFVIKKLEPFDEDDVFILVSENDDILNEN